MANSDQNFSHPTNKKHSFDLNTIPTDNGDHEHEDEGDLCHIESGGSIPITIISSSVSGILIDVNVNPEEDTDTQVELDLNQLFEENEDHLVEDQDVEEAGTYAEEDGSYPEEEEIINKTRKNLTNRQRRNVYNALLERSVEGKLKNNTTKEVSELLSVHIRTVQRIWKQGKDSPPGVLVDVSRKKKKRCGRKKIQIDLQRIVDIPLRKRTTLRTLGEALGISYTTLYRRVKEGLLRRHTNALKSYLTEDNKVARLRFCLSMLDTLSLGHEPKFINMHNIVHIDEKWFYMTKKSENYYLHCDEDDPIRTCKSKNFIGKVMFLAAMARPRFDDEGNELFSGKIGVFPFVTFQTAQRRSRNREAGTMEIKPMTSIKRSDIRRCLIEEVIPKIHERWPREDVGKTIIIQQDNAKTHVDPSDEEFRVAASQNGFDIRLMCQPPNSPDMNVLDLGFFSAIQALQHKVCPRNVEELIHAVKESFDGYATIRVNHIFLTLQLCMQETMRVGGDNNYKIPHMKKEALEREGCLPKEIICDPTIVENVINQLGV